MKALTEFLSSNFDEEMVNGRKFVDYLDTYRGGISLDLARFFVVNGYVTDLMKQDGCHVIFTIHRIEKADDNTFVADLHFQKSSDAVLFKLAHGGAA
ncbi:hypothetical protein G6L15_16255 [Agrobacterium rhizogenes]|uniref:hypothetical protein n=1 Tax=Rhizobium rhizogenes TaxID=359 RepID=UPI001571A1A4|nr:hypothetical protein [Rhizobium rhizogenes]NTG87705.1 hypothetical protein [Rhizobium rhizogenes]